MSSGVFEQKVEAWQGAPQTIYTDHFLETQPIDGPIGYKLEAPPLHPLIFVTSIGGFGREADRHVAVVEPRTESPGEREPAERGQHCISDDSCARSIYLIEQDNGVANLMQRGE